MKTKFTLLFVFSLFFLSSSFSQNSSQNPDSLNVTINDTTQNLQVNGSMVVDSSLTVKDSVIMEDNLHIYEKLQLEKDAHLKKDVYVGNEIKVEKDAHLQKDAYIGNEIKVEGDAYLLGNAFLMKKLVVPNLETLQDYDLSYFMFSKEDGVVEKKLVFDVLAEIYKNPCKTDLNGDVPSPTWQNGLNKIFTPCPNVNVGIGTDDPRVKLDVMGKAYVDYLAIGANPVQQTARFHLKVNNLTSTDASSIFIVENEERKLMQLNNQGLLNVREVKVDLEAWPDYVFEKKYKLRPLVEVENFIKINGHLPNIPNAKTIESEGVNLGEMNKLLMEKVEELTLYLIEQNKQLQMQNTRIESLEKTIENDSK